MENVKSNWGLTALIVASVIFVMPAVVFCSLQDWQDSDTQEENSNLADGEFEDLHLKADAEAREVNEAVKTEIEKAEAIKRTRYQEELGYIPKGNLLSDKERAAFENERLERINAIRSGINTEVNEVKQAFSYQQTPPKEVEEPYKAKPLKGTVTGIVIYQKKSAALIDGRIVRENNVIRDIKVLKIKLDSVEFEKQGKKWIQEVGQSPPLDVWEEKQPARAPQPPKQNPTPKK